MNLTENGERISKGDKGRGEIKDEAGEVSGMVANAPTMAGLGKRSGAFGGQRCLACQQMSISRKVTWEGKMVQVNWTG